QHDDTRGNLRADRIGLTEPAFVDEAHEAACAIAAVLDLAAVGVEDAIAKIRIVSGGGFDQKDLVGTNAELTVRQGPYPLRRDLYGLRDAIEHDKVVARAMHFCEVPVHHGIIASVVETRLATGAGLESLVYPMVLAGVGAHPGLDVLVQAQGGLFER